MSIVSVCCVAVFTDIFLYSIVSIPDQCMVGVWSQRLTTGSGHTGNSICLDDSCRSPSGRWSVVSLLKKDRRLIYPSVQYWTSALVSPRYTGWLADRSSCHRLPSHSWPPGSRWFNSSSLLKLVHCCIRLRASPCGYCGPERDWEGNGIATYSPSSSVAWILCFSCNIMQVFHGRSRLDRVIPTYERACCKDRSAIVCFCCNT